MASSVLIKAVAVTAELTGANFSEEAGKVLVAHLERYNELAVLAALSRCQAELRFPLTLAAIIERLDDGHLGPESAWALVVGLREDDTVVWTDQICRAWDVARRLIAAGDDVAGRMAFLEQYRNELQIARAGGVQPRWWPSLGHDAGQRTAVLAQAVERGWLSEGAVRRMLPEHEWPTAWTRRAALPESVDMQQAAHDAKKLVETLTRKKALTP